MVPSPCRNICVMHGPSGLCVGCGRTLDEIAAWSVLDDAAKRAVWTQLPQRMAALPRDADGGPDLPVDARGRPA